MAVDDLGVVIPYKDLAALLEAARSLDSLRADYDHVVKRLDTLRGLYSELLLKVNELEHLI